MYRAVDQRGQVIEVAVSKRRDVAATTRCFAMMLTGCERPREVTTDFAVPLLSVVDLVPGAVHDTTKYANTRVECDHGRLKARLEPMRGLGTDWTASMNNVTATATGGTYSYGVGSNGSSPWAVAGLPVLGCMRQLLLPWAPPALLSNYVKVGRVAD